jgi:hypothetical protein
MELDWRQYNGKWKKKKFRIKKRKGREGQSQRRDMDGCGAVERHHEFWTDKRIL